MKASKRKPRIRKPKHPMALRAYRFRLDVSDCDAKKLFATLHACWQLRNALAEDRINNRLQCKEEKLKVNPQPHYLTCADQYDAVKLYATNNAAWAKLHSQVRQNIAVRINEGYNRFFDAIKEGRKNVHPPRSIDEKCYRSFTYPQYGSSAFIRNGKLQLSNLGSFRVRTYRKIRGQKKTVTVKWMQGHWWVIVVAGIQEKDRIDIPSKNDIRSCSGGDPGLLSILTDAEGNRYDPPRAFAKYQAKLRTAQKKMSRQFEARKKAHLWLVKKVRDAGTESPRLKDMPYSNHLKKQIMRVARIHTKIENIRDYHHKKTASIVSSRYREFAIEDHGVQFMIRNRKLAKAALDRAIGKQKKLIQSKLGSRYCEVNASRPGIGGNSQTCVCGASVPKELNERVHVCAACGLVADRDHVSANIVQLIAFGTISPTLYTRHHGRMSSGVEGSKCDSAKAVRTSRVTAASESSMKRRSLHQGWKAHRESGEPIPEGKTSGHLQNIEVAA